MRSQKLSASGIKRYLKCPHQYFFHYHSNESPDVIKEDFHLHFGSIVHNALEIYRGMEAKEDKKTLSMYNALHYANKKYDNYTLDDTEFDDALQMLENWEETREYKTTEDVDGTELDVSLKSTEKEFNVDINDNFEIHGYIDVVEKIGPNHYRVRDYKSGKTFKTKRETHESTQLKMYSLATMQIYNTDNVEVAFDQLRFENPEWVHYTRKELQKFYRFIRHIHKTIKNDDEHHPQIGWYCRWCDYKNKCNAINDTKVLDNKDIAGMSLKELMAHYNQYSERSKTAKKISKQLRDRITDEMTEKGIDEYETQTHKLSKTQRKSKKVEPSSVMDKIPPEKIDDVLKVKNTELEKIVDEDEIDYGIDYSTSYLTVNKKDNKG